MHRISSSGRIGRETQGGAVLFVALVFLILLTLIGLTATGTSILQEKMTGGMRNRQLGLMGAESAMRGGEAYLWTLSFNSASGQPLPPCIDGNTNGCVHRPRKGALDATVQEFRTAYDWNVPVPAGSPTYSNDLTGLTGDAQTASLAEQPLIGVEDLGADVPGGVLGRQSGIYDPERSGPAGTAWLYRVTSRSQGGSPAVIRATESVFSAANLSNTGTEP
jgi:type IV pilus assembly protein PilX